MRFGSQLGEVPLEDVGLGDYAYGTVNTYWSRMAQALGDVAPATTAAPGSSDDIFLPPTRTHVSALIAAAESISGMPIGQLASLATNVVALSQATNAVDAVNAVRVLLDSTTNVATTVATAVDAAGTMAEVVPIIGQVVQAALGGLVAGLQFQVAQRQLTEECFHRLDAFARTQCELLWEGNRPRASRSYGVTPADLFRPVRYMMTDPRYGPVHLGIAFRASWGNLRPLPLSVASIYVALCGDVVPPPLMTNLNIQRDPALIDHKPGLPVSTRRRLWSLCRAIIEAAEPVDVLYAGGQTAPDGGVALFAAAQDIVFKGLRDGYLSRNYVRWLCYYLAETYKYNTNMSGSCEVFPGAGGTSAYYETTCRPFLGEALFQSWEQGLANYEQRLRELMADPPGSDNWVTRPVALSPKLASFLARPKTSLLVLSPNASTGLQQALKAAHGPTRGERIVAGASVATLAGAGAALLLTFL